MSVLNKILKKCFNEELFTISNLGQLDKSCCQKLNHIEVIDFDKTKKEISQKCGFLEPKSCDALKINTNNPSICFIEMKGWKEFIKHSKNGGTLTKKINNQIEKFAFEKKILDSLFIFETILHLNIMEMSRAELIECRSINRKYIILVDINIETQPFEAFYIDMIYLSQQPNAKEIESKIVDTLNQYISNLDFHCYESTPNNLDIFLCDCNNVHSKLE